MFNSLDVNLYAHKQLANVTFSIFA